MNFKTTLMLIVLLAVVGGYFYFVERHATTSTPSAQRGRVDLAEGETLFAAEVELSSETVDRITIDRGDSQFVLLRDGDDWIQSEPVQFKLSSWSVRSIIDAATATQKFKTLKSDDAADFFATVTFAVGDDTHVLHLGNSTIGGRAKLQLDDSADLLLVSDGLHKKIRNLKITNLRSKMFDAPGPAATTSLKIERADQTVTLLKADGRWYLDDPAQRGDTTEVEKVIVALGRVGVDTFIADAPLDMAVYGLDTPRTTITLTTPDRTVPDKEETQPGDHIVLRIGRAADLDGETFFATWSEGDTVSNVVFTVSKSDLEPFDVTLDGLRDSKLFTTTAPQVLRFSIEQGDTTLTLGRKTGEAYRFVEPEPGFEADYSEVTDLIDTTLSLTATDYDADFKPEGEPAVRVTVNDSDVVSLYDVEDGYLGVRSGERVAYRITDEDIKPLIEANALSLRDRTVLDLKAEDIQTITLSQQTRETFQVQRDPKTILRFVRNDEGAWALEEHETFEKEALDELIESLTPLRADHWDSDRLIDDLEKNISGMILLTIETAEGATYNLSFVAETGWLDSSDQPFVISKSLQKKLEAEYHDRTLLNLSSDDLVSVTVTRAGEPAIILSRDENGNYTTDADIELNSEAAAGIFDALAGLRVERHLPLMHGLRTVAPPPYEVNLQVNVNREGRGRVNVNREGRGWVSLSLLTHGTRTVIIYPGYTSDNLAHGLAKSNDTAAPYYSCNAFTLDQVTWDKLTADLVAKDPE